MEACSDMWKLAPICGGSLQHVEEVVTFGGLALKLWTIEKRVEQAGWKGGDKEKRHKIK